MAGYVIHHYKITDRSKIDELTQLSIPINEKYGAKVIVGSPTKALEGEMSTHMVILEFESFEAAETFYYSPENQELTKLRRSITEGWTTIIPGDSETQKIVDSGYFSK
ncbi:conserved hypothetical protein [Neptunomonas japonica JAMM 1380]|uniref:DUF1330 domain-containing protein n=2 Tax=Neptunomonas TaxID=75687 RepID=A0A7R6PJS4_9GAMM|nr:conserved hypothetical protein [Neptunomonas japonica JAMM 1380]